MSFECDQQLESVALDWASSFPNTTPIIVFRRHDSWIASQYRRFLKNCHVRTFSELLNLDTNAGLFKRKDLEFSKMVSLLDDIFDKKPIVLLYDDMRANPQSFIRHLSGLMNSSIDISSLDFSTKHSSYSEKQLKGLRATQKFINLRKKVVFKNKILEFPRKMTVNGTRYLILYISSLLPNSWFNSSESYRKEGSRKSSK